MKIKVGDIVKGISDRYSITNTKMTKAVVTKVKGSQIRIVIIEHLDGHNGYFDVSPEDFSVTGHVKEFNREEVLKSFETNKKALLEYNLRGANLRGANLRGANLQGADLRGANLWDADLQGANLQGANLQGANLRSADLRSADLQGADLQGANLRGANLWDADLQGANLQGADLDYVALPLCCKTLDMNVDDRQTIQQLYHLIRNALYSKNTSAEMKALLSTSALVEKANEFHRVSECGKIVVKKENEND